MEKRETCKPNEKTERSREKRYVEELERKERTEK
jgi:hypothetical protein